VIRYVDASAVVKLYAEEADSPRATELLDTAWTTGRHTRIEVRRAFAHGLDGDSLEHARTRFDEDWEATAVVELDARVCERAVALAEETRARTLDALHLAAAELAGADEGLPIVTFDPRLADAARSLGWTVLGA
jgi:predicted nucleic acid-binding protein